MYRLLIIYAVLILATVVSAGKELLPQEQYLYRVEVNYNDCLLGVDTISHTSTIGELVDLINSYSGRRVDARIISYPVRVKTINSNAKERN